MKFNRVVFFGIAALLSVFLSACGSPPLTNWPGLATDGKYAYLAAGQYVYAVQVSNGSETTISTPDGPTPLRFPLKADGNVSIYGTPALSTDGQMIFGNASTLSSTPLLYSIDPATSSIKWTFGDAQGIWLAGATVGKDAVYAAGGDGKVYALDLSGKKLWAATVSGHGLWSAPVTDGKLVYVATLTHDVIALDPQTGQQRWKLSLDNAILSSPAIGSDGNLYVGTLSGKLYAINAAEGSQVWQTTLDGSIWSTPAMDGNTLYVGTSSGGTAGKFYAINSADGKFAWPPLTDAGAIIAAPLVTKTQIVYVTEAGTVKFLNKDGSSSASPAAIENAKIYTTPVLAGDLILVAPMNASYMLAAYDQKGVQKWTFTPAK
jgi:outer membrane protein assembly factor BamB